VSPESDSGIDKLQVLSAITDAGGGPAPQKTAERPPSGARRAVEPPAPAWFRHRSEIAALVAAFAGMLWLAVGLAQKAWSAGMIGIAFGVASLAIWTLEVWGSD
jgi:hypothetical protein